MPAGLNEHDGGSWLKARIGHARVPLMQTAADGFALCLLAIFDWVIDDQEMGSPTCDGASAAHSVVRTGSRGIETAHAGRIFRQATAREDGLMQRVAHKIPHFATKVVSQFLPVSCSDDEM